MSRDNLLGGILGDSSGEVKIPDLDWLSLGVTDKDNIPTPNHVEIIPQLKDAWNYNKGAGATQLVPNNIAVPAKKAASRVSDEVITGVVETAKKAMMKGHVGKELANELSTMYEGHVIKAASDQLKKVAEEQGLLGNVYIDITPYDSCDEAIKDLGKNKVRMAKYIVGNPKRHVCASHKNGYCQCFRKDVVNEIMYDQDLFSNYTDHLRVAGKIASDEAIDSKEALREALLKVRTAAPIEKKEATEVPERTVDQVKKAFEAELGKKAEDIKKAQQADRFYQVRPVLAFIQDELLKGKMGNDLKEVIASRFSSKEIADYAEEIQKVASLQGLLGNIYVDISYYKNASEAIDAIKRASTSPTYIIQTVKSNEYDDTAVKVAKATGCAELPSDGKIDTKIAYSYLDDLQYNNRISSDIANALRGRVEANDNPLSVLREAFIATLDHKREQKEGGVQGHFNQAPAKKYAKRDNIRTAAYNALEAGIPLDRVESKVSSVLPTTEAVGMVRKLVASMKNVDADCLNNCTVERYQMSQDAVIKRASKCQGCIYNMQSACGYQNTKFAGEKDLNKPFFDLGEAKIDPKTAKVQLEENPDLARTDIGQEYDMGDGFGSGMNISLENMRKEASEDTDIDVSYNNDGIDLNIMDD